MKDKTNIPNAPKSKKFNSGIYFTNTKFGIVEVMKNEGTGMWQTIHQQSGEWMQSYWTKKDALNDLRK